jgi:hypothetical protein
MARQTRHWLSPCPKQSVNLNNFGLGVISNFLVPDKLQLGILQPEFIHHIHGMSKIAANAVANNPQFHFLAPH